KSGSAVEALRSDLKGLVGREVRLNIVEIGRPELDAQLVARNIAESLEKRIAFRRAIKQAIQRTMRFGAKGIKVIVAGRLGGAEMARREREVSGKVPLHTLRADIDYGTAEAATTYGRIGVKVWIYKGDVIGKQKIRVRAPEEREVVLAEGEGYEYAEPAYEPYTPYDEEEYIEPGEEPEPEIDESLFAGLAGFEDEEEEGQ
ncbi:MAG: 30S ribosomal protein S3, partial [Chloroflexota bacterium]|nr:30S ribosomal protein S3 [Chloroflexota bacterium]